MTEPANSLMRSETYGPWPKPARPSLLKLIVDYNPFFLLSAVSMVFGCYLLNSGIAQQPGHMVQDLLVLLALNVYEVSIIALGWWLSRRPGAHRDGWILLTLESIFLVDATFLNANLVLTDLTTGLVLNGLLFVLAVAKLLVILRALGPGVRRGQVGFMVLQLGLLYGLPAAFRALGPHGEVPALSIYALWWLVGLLPVVYDLLARLVPEAMDLGKGHVGLKRFFLVLPFVSLVAHLGFNHWVYKTTFYAADLSPLILGLAVVAGRLRETPTRSRAEIRMLQGALLAVAWLVAAGNPAALDIHVLGSTLSPVVLTVAAAVAAAIYCYFYRIAYWLLAGEMLVGAGLLFGPRPATIGHWLAGWWQWAMGGMRSILPKTGTGWGVVAMAGAFVLLGLGVLATLRRERRHREELPLLNPRAAE